MKEVLKLYFAYLKCYFLGHEWTSKSQQGIRPTPDEVARSWKESFKDYAKMYCSRCGKESKYNSRLDQL